MSQRLLIIKPGPKRLCAALWLAGFSPTVTLPPITDLCGRHKALAPALVLALAIHLAMQPPVKVVVVPVPRPEPSPRRA